MKLRSLALALSATAIVGQAWATPYAPFDVRAAGMGGTGVASAKSASAALFNPAMLSTQVEGDRFQFVLGAGATVADEDEMYDQIDGMQTSIDAMNAVLSTPGIGNLRLQIDRQYSAADTGADLTAYNAMTTASSSTGDIATRLGNINGDNLVAGLGAGLGFGVPGPSLGVGVFVTGSTNVVTTPVIASQDLALLQKFSDLLGDAMVSQAELLNPANAEVLLPVLGDVTKVDINTFNPQSQARGLAIAMIEYGVSFSHRYDMGESGALSVGVTPKAVSVTTYDYTQGVETFDDEQIDALEKTEDIFDLDLGLVYKPSATSAWQYGLTVKHVIGGDFTTMPNTPAAGAANTPDTISIEPQLRAGVARMTERSTLALDLDLTENTGVTPSTDTQFLALGAEYDLSFLQLRAGYRANLASSDVSDAATVGLGLGPLDVSAVLTDGSVGAYLQLGFGW